MKKNGLEMLMTVLLLAGVWVLSREAALAANGGDLTQKVILVDPGHGGGDPGMVGVDGLEEKEINLQIAGLLKEKLEQRGYQVVMTRKGKEGLYGEAQGSRKAQDMQNRCKLIGETKALLNVSIHQNSYPDPAVRGPQVFYYAHSQEGERLAETMQAALNEQLEVERPREAKANDSYYLLRKSEGVLNIVECGFLTNPEEAALLQQKHYQEKVAEAICDGIITYLEQKEAAL